MMEAAAVKENIPPANSKPLSEVAPEPVLYKQLYHASVERCEFLQAQLEKYSTLLSKHQKITELKNQALSGLERNRVLINGYRDSLVQKEVEWQQQLSDSLLREETAKKENAKLSRQYEEKVSECEELKRWCGVLVARVALARAETRAKDTVIHSITSRNEMETEKLKKKMASYSRSFKRQHSEIKESLEFSEAERAALVEANAEAECLVQSLKAELEEKTRALDQAKSSESNSHPPVCQPDPQTSTCPAPPSIVSSHQAPPPSCPACDDLNKQLSVALSALNNRGCANYGNLLHEKFVLEQKLQALESKLSAGLQEHQKLMQYTQEYKARSVEKVCILKENIKKADQEIAELDKMVEMVRKAMHTNMSLIRQSPTLLQVLLEIDGTGS